jgi:hypothetical protein
MMKQSKGREKLRASKVSRLPAFEPRPHAAGFVRDLGRNETPAHEFHGRLELIEDDDGSLAVQENVIPSDSALTQTLRQTKSQPNSATGLQRRCSRAAMLLQEV